MRVGYKRVSTLEQSTQRQLDGVTLDKCFEDKLSGKDRERPQLQAAINFVREGDTLVIHSLDRLARNLVDLCQIVKELNGKGVTVSFQKEQLTFAAGKDDPFATLQMQMLASFAQFERSLLLQRQREGIAIAKTKGLYKGRKQTLTGAQVEQLRARAALGAASKADLAEEYGISRQTLYTYLRAAENKELESRCDA
jgi:DNA invertase Pin-like site-specific DNA recombinase